MSAIFLCYEQTFAHSQNDSDWLIGLMEVMLQCKSIDVNARDKDDLPPLHIIMKDHSDRDKLRMLLERKVTLSGDTPLHLARQQRVDVQVLMALLSVQSINMSMLLM